MSLNYYIENYKEDSSFIQWFNTTFKQYINESGTLQGTRINRFVIMNGDNPIELTPSDIYFQYFKQTRKLTEENVLQFFIMLHGFETTSPTSVTGQIVFSTQSAVNTTRIEVQQPVSYSQANEDVSKITSQILKPLIIRWVDNNTVDKPEIKQLYLSWINGPDFDSNLLKYSKDLGELFKDNPGKETIDFQDSNIFTLALSALISLGLNAVDAKVFNVANFKNDLLNGTNEMAKSIVDIPSIFGLAESLKQDGFIDKGRADLDELERILKDNPEKFKELSHNAQGVEYKEPTEEQLINYRQCGLVTELLHQGIFNFGTYISGNIYNSPLNYSLIDNNRIYPVSPDYDATELNNYISISNDAKNTLRQLDGDYTPRELRKSLFWVFEGSDNSLKEAEITLNKNRKNQQDVEMFFKLTKAMETYNNSSLSTEEQKRNVQSILMTEFAPSKALVDKFLTKEISRIQSQTADRDTYYYLKDLEVKFEGTNISTARKDVQVTMKFFLSSLQALEEVLLTIPQSQVKGGDANGEDIEIKLYDLITLPNTNKISKGPGAYLKNQYNPEYSRVRLKVSTEVQTQSDLIIDLTTVDHQIQRDSTSGNTELLITYRGFFETMMNMPFNDVLASPEILKDRAKVSSDIMQKIKTNNCESGVLREALRLEQEIYRAQSKTTTAGSILKRLADRNVIHSYQLDETKLSLNSINGSLNPYYNYVTKVSTPNGDVTTLQLMETLDEQQKKKSDDQDEEVIADALKNKFFFLGDLMWVMSNCLFEEDSDKMLPLAKSMNIRFMVGCIEVPDPKDTSQKLTINPVCIPIDLAFFTEWFNSTVVSKGLSTYAVGIFIRDLLDKLVNNIIYDVCFVTLPPGESPPIIRSQINSDFSTDGWFQRNKDDSWFYPLNPLQDGSTRPCLFLKDAYARSPEKISDVDPQNYIVIYQQFPSFSYGNVGSGKKNLKDSQHVPTIFYGNKNTKYNYVSNVTFSKTNSQFLREARYFNSNYGNLSLLSNVYDLSFSFNRRKANTFFYPGCIINFVLLDWDTDLETKSPYELLDESLGEYGIFNQNNPHSNKTLAHILGLGGYYMIKSVSYKMEQLDTDWTISISTKFLGTDGKSALIRESLDPEAIEDKKACEEAFNEIRAKAQGLGIETQNTTGDTGQPAEGERQTEVSETPPAQGDEKSSRIDFLKGKYGEAEVYLREPPGYGNLKLIHTDIDVGDSLPLKTLRSIKEDLKTLEPGDNFTAWVKSQNGYFEVFSSGDTVTVKYLE